ncbi:uncharacterized protein [Ambystoma mexicanum]|uniref:uncharacterized protein n=1 Tax=Ambystoma mexicanum TaxID=8296 RepID=UPI0037E7CC67
MFPVMSVFVLWSCYVFLAYLSMYLCFSFLRSLLTSDNEKQKVTARIRRKRRRRGRTRLSTRMTFQRKSTH